jgi:HNH endonuclease
MTRPAIPADLKRRVLIEAGHRCSIPTCRIMEIDLHHIIPWEKCLEHRYENLIALCPNCHRKAHDDTIDKKALRIYKANLRYTHDKFSQFEVDLLFEASKVPVGSGIFYPAFCDLFVKRLLDAGYITLNTSEYNVNLSGVQLGPKLLSITTDGMSFVESLGLDQDN